MALVAVSALALPDLEPELYGVRFDPDQTVGTGDVAEGCAGATDRRLLLRFGVRFHNVGADPLVIGDPGCPVCALNPGAICEDPRFICSPADGHNHPHLVGFANYELLDFQGNTLGGGGKKSFCVRDNRCDGGTPVFDCTNQGISPGCVDDYDPSLGCQYRRAGTHARAGARAARSRSCASCHMAVASCHMAVKASMQNLVASLGGRKTLGERVETERDLRGHVRKGLPYASVTTVMVTYGVDAKTLARVLAIPERTLARRRHEKRLRVDESDRVVRMARIAAIAEETLGDRQKAVRWLHRPNRALGNTIPLEHLDTELGAREVEDVLGRIAHGVHS